jgi:flagellar basal-body rod protein FlgB
MGRAVMPITDIPILSMLRERMEWHQERQRVLAENVANSDTPNYHAKDLAPLDFAHAVRTASLTLDRTDPGHLNGAANGTPEFGLDRGGRFEVRPRGNSVTHEDEMMKVASNQMDYEAVTSLYTRSLALIRTAIGR